jgi:hypothetical protein
MSGACDGRVAMEELTTSVVVKVEEWVNENGALVGRRAKGGGSVKADGLPLTFLLSDFSFVSALTNLAL